MGVTSAEQLYAELDYELHQTHVLDNIPACQKISERLPTRFTEIHVTRSNALYKQWFESHNDELIDAIAAEIFRIDKEQLTKNEQAATLLAIASFLKDRDTKTGIKLLTSFKGHSNFMREFNLGFLYAYNKDLDTAYSHYRKALNYKMDDLGLATVEEFIMWVLSKEPDKYELHFCVGFINFKIKRDNLSAEKDLQLFLDKCPANMHHRQCQAASAWLQNIRSKS